MSVRRNTGERKRQKELRKEASAPRRRARLDRKRKHQTIFINGKQKRVARELIDGMTIDEFTLANADPIWLHQNEMWELLRDPVRPDDSGF